jgi:hypothetical protein
MTEPTFTDYVELHERKWGEQQYLGRPNLKQLLNVPIVAMWKNGKRFKFSVHASTNSLLQAIQAVLFGAVNEEESRSLYKIFYHHQEQTLSINISLDSQTEAQSTTAADQVSVEDSSPRILDVNPQRNTKPHDDPHYNPRVIEGAKYGESAPGRNEPHKPGRNVPLLKPKSEDRK